jgi:hypothetical protein
LAKIQWTFANWRNSRESIGESMMDFRQLVTFQGRYWRKYGGLSQLLRNYINIRYMSKLKLMLLEFVYYSSYSSM